MANNNNNKDYNYYKSEYGKFKNNYYSPGVLNNSDKKKKNNGGKKFLKVMIIFIIVFGIIALLAFGGMKIYKVVSENRGEKESSTAFTTVATTVAETTTSEATTEEKTTKAPSTTKSSQDKITANSEGYISTPSGDSVYLRHNPTYDEYGYAPLTVGTKVVICEISEDGEWGKTSNFDINGWIYLKYVTLSSPSGEKTTSKPVSTEKSDSSKFKTGITFDEALEIFMADTEKNHYMICTVSSDTGSVYGVYDYNKPDKDRMGQYMNGQSVNVYEVRYDYARISQKGLPNIWIPTSCLVFDSWGKY